MSTVNDKNTLNKIIKKMVIHNVTEGNNWVIIVPYIYIYIYICIYRIYKVIFIFLGIENSNNNF
jgi:hypothetical protein